MPRNTDFKIRLKNIFGVPNFICYIIIAMKGRASNAQLEPGGLGVYILLGVHMKVLKSVFFFGLCFALSVVQAIVLWSISKGSASFFDWANGQSDNGLYGDPTLVGGDTLVFFPTGFRAESFNGVTSKVSDRLQFELVAHAGFSFDNILISEFGDYGVFGEGTVRNTGQLFVQNLDSSTTLSDTLSTDPASPITSGQGTFTAEAQVYIDQADWAHIRITLENNLLAMTSPGSAAFIEKKTIGDAIAIQIIPEPATISLISFGSMLFLVKKRKKAARLYKQSCN